MSLKFILRNNLNDDDDDNDDDENHDEGIIDLWYTKYVLVTGLSNN